MKKWPRFFFPLFTALGYLFLRLYRATWRVKFILSDETRKALESNKEGALLLIWHDSLLALPFLSFLGTKRQVSILISKSRDGEIPARIARLFRGVETIRVQGSARFLAVQESLKALSEHKLLLITPDGPRGPRRVMKPGTCFLAQKTGAKLFTMGWTASKCLSLKTWDRFRLPLPFSKVVIRIVGPLPGEEEQAYQALTMCESSF